MRHDQSQISFSVGANSLINNHTTRDSPPRVGETDQINTAKRCFFQKVMCLFSALWNVIESSLTLDIFYLLKIYRPTGEK